MRLRDMKKLFIALAAVALTACVKAPEKTVKVYAWQGEGENTTEQTLQADVPPKRPMPMAWNTMRGFLPCCNMDWTPPSTP